MKNLARLILLALVVAMVTVPAAGEMSGCTDAAADTFDWKDDPAGSGPIDIGAGAVGDTADRAFYVLTTYRDFDAGDINEVTWFLELDGDPGDIEALVRVRPGEGGVLEGTLLRVDPGPTLTKIADAFVSHADGTARLSVEFARGSLGDAGLTGSSYGFALLTSTGTGDSERFDTAPDDVYCTHTLSTNADTSTPAAASPTRVDPGQPIALSGSGFAPSAVDLAVAFDGDRTLATIDADAGGAYATEVIIPPDASPGAHGLTVAGPNGSGGGHVSFADVTVPALVATPSPTPSGSPLPTDEPTPEPTPTPPTEGFSDPDEGTKVDITRVGLRHDRDTLYRTVRFSRSSDPNDFTRWYEGIDVDGSPGFEYCVELTSNGVGGFNGRFLAFGLNCSGADIGSATVSTRSADGGLIVEYEFSRTFLPAGSSGVGMQLFAFGRAANGLDAAPNVEPYREWFFLPTPSPSPSASPVPTATPKPTPTPDCMIEVRINRQRVLCVLSADVGPSPIEVDLA